MPISNPNNRRMGKNAHFFIFSIQRYTFEEWFQEVTRNSVWGNFFYDLLKMAPKLLKFSLKSPIFGRFQNFFFRHSTTHRDTHFTIKKKFCPKKYVVSRFKKRFTPILGSKKRKTPYLSPGWSEAKNFLGINQGWVGAPNELLTVWIGKNRYAALG